VRVTTWPDTVDEKKTSENIARLSNLVFFNIIFRDVRNECISVKGREPQQKLLKYCPSILPLASENIPLDYKVAFPQRSPKNLLNS
jgi:hypothetical protein